MAFNGEGVEDPKEAGNAMISAVREAYEQIYAKLSPIINAAAREPAVERKPKRSFAFALGMAIATLIAVVAGSCYAGYHYAPYTVLADKVMSALR